MARWGLPGPPQYGGQPVTNIRNVKSPHWRGWLGKRNRCIVPATSFCEYADTKPRKTPIWFALTRLRGFGHFLVVRVKEINTLTEKVFTTGGVGREVLRR